MATSQNPNLDWPLALQLVFRERHRSSRISPKLLADLGITLQQPVAGETITAGDAQTRITIDTIKTSDIFRERRTRYLFQYADVLRDIEWYTDAKKEAGDLTCAILRFCLSRVKRVGGIVLHRSTSTEQYELTTSSKQWKQEKRYKAKCDFAFRSPTLFDQVDDVSYDTCALTQIGEVESAAISGGELFAALCLAKDRMDADEYNAESYVVRVLSVRGSFVRRLKVVVPRTYFMWLLWLQNPLFADTQPQVTITQSPYWDATTDELEKIMHVMFE